MEKIGDTLAKQLHNKRHDLNALTQKILMDTEIVDFISSHGLTQEQITRSLPKFNQFMVERDKFQQGDASYVAKGYRPALSMNEGYADVVYLETRELVEAKKQQDIKNRVTLMGLPSSFKQISTDDIDLDDPNRIEIYHYITEYINRFDMTTQKGLYVFGTFGVGKSYLMAYLANRLSAKYGKSTTILHFPTFCVGIKSAINTGTVKEEIDQLKAAEILILDDIGAEQFSPWIRDDVLQVILQYRMQENLLTFFTSNLDFKDLEAHFATSRSGDETWQAKRIMERIRYLAKEIHLQGDNRRWQHK